jgi:hypothetical protein
MLTLQPVLERAPVAPRGERVVGQEPAHRLLLCRDAAAPGDRGPCARLDLETGRMTTRAPKYSRHAHRAALGRGQHRAYALGACMKST